MTGTSATVSSSRCWKWWWVPIWKTLSCNKSSTRQSSLPIRTKTAKSTLRSSARSSATPTCTRKWWWTSKIDLYQSWRWRKALDYTPQITIITLSHILKKRQIFLENHPPPRVAPLFHITLLKNSRCLNKTLAMPKIFFTSDKKMCFSQLVIKNILGVFWFVFPSQCLCAIFYLIDF